MNVGTVIESLECAAEFRELKSILRNAADDYKLRHFIYVSKFPTSFLRPSIVIINGYPQEWHDAYIQNNYAEVDPVLAKAETEILPIIWSDLEKEGLTESSMDFMAEAKRYELCNGITLPFRGSFGESALLSLSTDCSSIGSISKLVEASRMFLLLMPYLHNKVRELSVINSENFEQYLLSDKELECLMWCAEGKTTWEISQILGMKDRTVKFHFQNICEKLNTVNRQQSVAKAIALGIIKPHISNGFKRPLSSQSYS